MARNATDDEIRRAYEQRLAAAAAAGALRTMQKVDAAFSLLRDPHRRATFDREGRIIDQPRIAPDQRWAPPARVPSRTWSPATTSPRLSGVRRQGERARTVLVLLVTVSLLGAGLAFGVFGRTRGTVLASDIWRSSSGTPSTYPFLRHAGHRERLLTTVPSPIGSGPYAFEVPAAGGPVRWDPCSPIHYVISGSQPFPAGDAMLTSAIDEVSADTGLQFVYTGSSTERPATHRAPYQPDRYGERWAPVLIAWTDATVLPQLAGPVAGIGGGTSVTIDGQPRVVSGIVAFDAPDFAAQMQRSNGTVEARAIMLHELGHLVGLAHVPDPTEIMNPTTMPLAHYALGDRQGLAVLGDGPCPATY